LHVRLGGFLILKLFIYFQWHPWSSNWSPWLLLSSTSPDVENVLISSGDLLYRGLHGFCASLSLSLPPSLSFTLRCIDITICCSWFWNLLICIFSQFVVSDWSLLRQQFWV
jgi:hypothetical protein